MLSARGSLVILSACAALVSVCALVAVRTVHADLQSFKPRPIYVVVGENCDGGNGIPIAHTPDAGEAAGFARAFAEECDEVRVGYVLYGGTAPIMRLWTGNGVPWVKSSADTRTDL